VFFFFFISFLFVGNQYFYILDLNSSKLEESGVTLIRERSLDKSGVYFQKDKNYGHVEKDDRLGIKNNFLTQTGSEYHYCGARKFCPANLAFGPSSSSMRSSWLYLQHLSDRQGAPVLI